MAARRTHFTSCKLVSSFLNHRDIDAAYLQNIWRGAVGRNSLEIDVNIATQLM
jgi:hypothetical protein